jgi:hypothetical protein
LTAAADRLSTINCLSCGLTVCLGLLLLCAQAKFIIDKAGNVVERNGDNPMASEAKLQQLLAA